MPLAVHITDGSRSVEACYKAKERILSNDAARFEMLIYDAASLQPFLQYESAHAVTMPSTTFPQAVAMQDRISINIIKDKKILTGLEGRTIGRG
jgi:hypothetical protein